MIQILLFILAFFGFAPATPRAAGVGPGPTARRRALYKMPKPRVVHPVAQFDRPVVQPAAAREAAHRMGVHTTGLVRRIPAGRAVRWLQFQAGCAPSDQGLPGVTRIEVEISLGADLVAYVDLCISERTPLPSISPARECEDDALYRIRLARALVDDIELWEAAARSRDRQRADAQAAGRPQPPALRLPHEVELAIARRAAAALAALRRRRESQGGAGATGRGGSNLVAFPAGNQSTPPEGPPPQRHDEDASSVPGLK